MIKWAGPPSWSVLLWSTPIYSARSGIFGGAIADRFGAKPMIVTGYTDACRRIRHNGIADVAARDCGFHACFRDWAARCLIRRVRRWW
ncbi:hypothetical protein ACLB1O_12490 [Escherichia coli]